MRVLVVEDDEDMRFAVVGALRKAGRPSTPTWSTSSPSHPA
ncbi:response regulator [Alloactinosynnema sp. L-07]|nr:response regulator [Alloactinosynnema sp. L-07]